MNTPKLFLLICLAWMSGSLVNSKEALALTPLEQTLIGLPANTWYSVPNTHMRDVCAPEYFGVGGVEGCGAIVEAWGGGAFDPVHRKMIIWGGGHETYRGNEVYAFDIRSARWERLTDPSPGPYNRDPLDDGNPVSRHAFDGLQYITHANRFFGYGGARTQDGNGTSLTWIFDVDARTWQNMQPAGPTPGVGHIYQLSSAYHPKTKNIYLRDPYYLYSYNYDTNSWTQLWSWDHSWNPQTAAIDTQRDLYFTIADLEWLVYDIANDSNVSLDWNTTGGDALNAAGAGLDYDSYSDNLVAWNGGAVYVLNMQTKVWSSKSGVGAPEFAQRNGTYGRWRYIPEYNVFMLVNSVDDNVYFYKHTAQAPPPNPTPTLSLNTTGQSFPTTTVNSASGVQSITLTNTGDVPVNITAISLNGPFTQTSSCLGSLAPGASCTINVTFRPTAVGSAAGTLTITYAGGGLATVSLSGFGAAFNLVVHYYQSILGRAPDAVGKSFWEGEAARMQGMSVDIKEAYMVMAGFFFNSAEYLGRGTSNTQYVTDLYNTFFNRAPDSGGLAYWNSQLASGLPRKVVMESFLFSTEFGSFMTGLFGTTTSRAEVYAVVDFYRGILGRLPDTAGFASWLGQFRTAQCSGAAAPGAIYNAVESISAAFIASPEYLGRSRNNTDYVSDLYYAFLRRGGDLAGVNFWINRLNTGVETREQMRRNFINTPEFNGRVNAIIAQGCYRGP